MDDDEARLRQVARYGELSAAQAEALQQACAARVEARWDGREVRLLAGADTAYRGGGDALGQPLYAAIVVLDAQTLEIVETARAVGRLEVPYRPGMLSFREVPLLVEAWSRLRTAHTDIDLLMVDGHGRVHPRRCGLACHLGVLLDVPTLGVAKSRFVGSYAMPDATRGACAPITLDGQEVGRVVRTRSGVKPVYVSIGHRIDLDTACAWAVRSAREARVPEPTRQADLEAERMCRTVARQAG